MKKSDIKEDLLNQLYNAGVHGKHYEDMIDKYIEFWETDKKLKADIKKYGTMVPSGTGFKANPALKERRDTNTQMLKILTTLGLKAPASVSAGEDDEFEDV